MSVVTQWRVRVRELCGGTEREKAVVMAAAAVAVLMLLVVGDL